MPLWRIYHPSSIYTSASERQAFASAITALYTSVGLPAFYVNVFFIPLPSSHMFVGGRTTDPTLTTSTPLPGSAGTAPFVRIYGSNIARRMASSERKKTFMLRVEEAIRPWVADLGFDWEVHFDETERELWRMQGLEVPETGSEEERRWGEEGRAVPWQRL